MIDMNETRYKQWLEKTYLPRNYWAWSPEGRQLFWDELTHWLESHGGPRFQVDVLSSGARARRPKTMLIPCDAPD